MEEGDTVGEEEQKPEEISETFFSHTLKRKGHLRTQQGNCV